MTTTEPQEPDLSVTEVIRNTNRLDGIFAHAYSYLNGLITSYLDALIDAEDLRSMHERLTLEVAKGVERVLSTNEQPAIQQPAPAGGSSEIATRRPPRLMTTRFEEMETEPDHTP